MTPVERLAAAMHRAGGNCSSAYGCEPATDIGKWHETRAWGLLRADPSLAEAIAFHEAWTRVLAALPEGWYFNGLTSPGRFGTWYAVTESRAGADTGIGATPTAALEALAIALEARK